MHVREAEFRDCKRITDFLEVMHKEHELRARFSRDRVRKVVQVASCNPKFHKVWIAEVDGEVHGVLIGVTNQIWYSPEKEALDMVFVTDREGRGSGAVLATRFLRWAKTEAVGVRWIYMSQTEGRNERLERMLQTLGFEQTGGVFRQEVTE